MKHRNWHNYIPGWLLILVTVFVAVFFVCGVLAMFMRLSYQDKIYPGVTVAGLTVGGDDANEARQKIENKIREMEDGIPVRYEKTEVIIAPQTVSLNPDLDRQFILFDVDDTLANAFNIGRGEHLLDNVIEQMAAFGGRYSLDMAISTDRAALTDALKSAFSSLEHPAKNADLVIGADGKAIIDSEENGIVFDYDATVTKLFNQFQSGDRSQVLMTARQDTAKIKRSDIRVLQNSVDQLLKTKPTELRFDKQVWELGPKELEAWIGVVEVGGKIELGLNPDKIKTYLEKEVAPKVGRDAVEAKLMIENGRVTVWQAGQDGIAMDTDLTAERIAAWPAELPEAIEIAVKEVKNVITDQSAEELGLKEILGTGVSNFSGSPANRRHNIKVGAMALNGLLIKPGEEFSLLKALGSIDAKAGYLPELVIKENKTIPEYGGGLCQIGTTAFRATFNSGLPVTARRNHSYRVAYYEPAGTDATIYDPAPDYKFLNDTGHYILIQTRLGQNEVAFDFWGTKDGRTATATKPVIYNIVQPKPTKIVETTDLPEGQKKCTEKAHAGADAYFDYTVEYPNGEVKQQRFSSHYVPWQAVCLVGAKKPLPASGTPGTPTSTVTPTVSGAIQ